MNFKGVIIEESLKDKSILKALEILKTRVEEVTPKHLTPWLKRWTLHTVSIPAQNADEIAKKISKSFDYSHKSAWYADFNNGEQFYVIYKDKIFKWKKGESIGPQKARDWGITLGIPQYQVDFPSQ